MLILEKILLPLIVGAVGAWLGARWGFEKYQKEKFWDRKLQSYGRIISEIETIGFWGLSQATAAYDLPMAGGRVVEKNAFHLSMRVLAQLDFTERFYLSNDAYGIMTKFIKDVQDEYRGTLDDCREEPEPYIEQAFNTMYQNIANIAYRALGEFTDYANLDTREGKNHDMWSKAIKNLPASIRHIFK